jgi:hypothetical protein
MIFIKDEESNECITNDNESCDNFAEFWDTTTGINIKYSFFLG